MGCLANLAVGVNITRNRAYLSLSLSRTRRLMEVYLLALWQGPPSILKLDTNNPRLCSRSVKYIGSVLSLLTQFAFARRYHLSFPFDKGNDRYRAFYRDFARKFVTISHVMAVSRDGGSIHRWHVSFSLDFSSRGTSFLSLIENVRQKFTCFTSVYIYIYVCVIKFWSFGLQIFSLSFSFSFCLLTSSIISIYNIVFNEVI